LPPINLYSDTQTRPTDGMRAVIAAAVGGDEQRGLCVACRRVARTVPRNRNRLVACH
jgi:hypothetical protein